MPQPLFLYIYIYFSLYPPVLAAAPDIPIPPPPPCNIAFFLISSRIHCRPLPCLDIIYILITAPSFLLTPIIYPSLNYLLKTFYITPHKYFTGYLTRPIRSAPHGNTLLSLLFDFFGVY